MGDQYIKEFINETKTAYAASQLMKRQQKGPSRVDSILENMYVNLIDLEDDINF